MKFRALNFDYHAEAVYRAEQRAESSRAMILLCDASPRISKNPDNMTETDITLSSREDGNQEAARELRAAETYPEDETISAVCIESDKGPDSVAVSRSKKAGLLKFQSDQEVRPIDRLNVTTMLFTKSQCI